MVTRETSISDGLSRLGIRGSDQVVRRLARLAHLLENDAVDLGFLGPNEGQRVVSRHLLESAALDALIPDGFPEDRIVDVGSGAGLPGMVLAVLGRSMILIDSLSKRAEFLRSVASELGVAVEVRSARAEDAGRGELRDSAAAAVARALAAPAVALELCLPLVRPGGRLAVLASPGSTDHSINDADERERRGEPCERNEPPIADRAALAVDDPSGSAPVADAEDSGLQRRGRPGEVADAVLSSVSRQLGGAEVRWRRLPVPGADPPRWVMMVDKRGPTPDRFPRRPGVPKRRPLGGDVESVN